MRPALAFLVVSAVLASPGSARSDVAIARQDCDWLVKHVAAPDVTYQPGVDVHGRAVVPADLNGGVQLVLPETIYIPIEILIQDRFQIPSNSVLYDARAQVGVVEVIGDQVYYEGQPLTDPEIAALEAICRDQTRQ